MCSPAHLPALVTIISLVMWQNWRHNCALSRCILGPSVDDRDAEPSAADFCCASAACRTDEGMVEQPFCSALFRASILGEVAQCLSRLQDSCQFAHRQRVKYLVFFTVLWPFGAAPWQHCACAHRASFTNESAYTHGRTGCGHAYSAAKSVHVRDL